MSVNKIYRPFPATFISNNCHKQTVYIADYTVLPNLDIV